MNKTLEGQGELILNKKINNFFFSSKYFKNQQHQR
jgi:hypothetical protein